MAERNLCVVANRILGLLRSEDIKKMGSLWGVAHRELLQGLEDTISVLAPLLLDAEKKSFNDERLRGWVRMLGEALYDADNLLDDFSTAALRDRLMSTRPKMSNVTKKVRRLFSTSNPLTSPFKAPNELKEIKKKLDEIARHRSSFALEERTERQSQAPPEVRATDPSFVEKEEVFGRNHDKDIIVKTLLDEESQENVTVLPIVGMGGVGKTTLARDVFNDERIRRYFELKIWVCVSDNFDVRKIVEEICQDAAKVRTENLALEQLQRLVRESLSGKRCLIVLDDVWNEEYKKWDHLKSVLSAGARGSSTILTTRSKVVAYIAGTIPSYHLKLLSDEESWTLFQRMAFGDQNSEDLKSSNKISIGKEIARRCEGHPLFIKAIGGILYFENSEAEWQFFYEKELPTMMNSEYFYTELAALKLSYDHLPSPLKQCFAYCSLFPNDHEIDVQTLVKLWMAQGFIDPHTSDKSLEDVGYGYFMNLLRRSFFHEVTMDVRGRVTKCKMHDLMHDIATSVARGQCFSLYDRWHRHENIDRSASHVSFVSDLSSSEHVLASASLIAADKLRKLRSILLPGNLRREDRGRPDDKIFPNVISRCRFLWVLDMHALGIKKVPDSIGKLYHLRYLDLSENEYITQLPDSVTELLNLQTLRLSSCFELKRLPRDIGNLINLRHLEVDGCYNLVSLPRGLGRLTNLQTLSQLVLSEDASTRSDELEEFRRLNHLRDEFEIKNLKHGKDDLLAEYLGVIKEVRSLSLEWECHAPESDDGGTTLNSNLFSNLEELTLYGFRGVNLFWPTFPSNLVKLTVRRWVKGKNLAPLSQCFNLKVLVLDEITDLEYVENEHDPSSTAFFPALTELWLTELPELQGWWKTEVNSENLPSFPCLSKLVIEDCPKLDSMPLFPTLEGGLVLDSTCWKKFQRTMDKNGTTTDKDEASSSNSMSTPLSKLKNLCIVGIPKFDDLEANKIKWINLESLQLLKFDSLPELTTLPEGLQRLTRLRELHVWRSGMKLIPAWIGELKTLEKLVIRACPNLLRLPEEFSSLKLNTLEIEDCPTLLRRCEEGIGADWDKIRHISDLRLGRISGR